MSWIKGDILPEKTCKCLCIIRGTQEYADGTIEIPLYRLIQFIKNKNEQKRPWRLNKSRVLYYKIIDDCPKDVLHREYIRIG